MANRPASGAPRPISLGAKAVLLELDGTLLDTAPDLIGSLNDLRLEQGLPALAAEPLAAAELPNRHGRRRVLPR
ncbi:MAG: hypothetical protein L0H73_04820 [Nitrococcus sp.]|nr:hypothetical protein [Nitrococcus sp.]